MNNFDYSEFLNEDGSPKVPCGWCKRDDVNLHTHHIVPVSEGGTDELDNLVRICPDCHYKAHHEPRKRVDEDIFSQGWGILPRMVALDKELSWFDKVLYSEISSLSAERGYCWASNNSLENKFGVSQSTLSKALTRLEKYVVYEDRLSGRRKIHVTRPSKKPLGKKPKVVENNYVKVVENALHNNTSYNNTSISISKDIDEKVVKKELAISGKSSLQRIVNFYGSLWSASFGARPTVNYPRAGKALKPVLDSHGEYLTALLLMQYFKWRGATGDDDFLSKRLQGSAYPLYWFPDHADAILAYVRNVLKFDVGSEEQAKKVVDARIAEFNS